MASPASKLPVPSAEKLAVFDGVEILLQPAPIKKRMLAFCVDLGAVFVMAYGVLLVGAVVLGAIALQGSILSQLREAGSPSSVIGWIILTAALLLALLATLLGDTYFIFHELKRGETPGKRIFGLKVIPLKSARLTFGQVALRDVFRYIDAFLVVPGLLAILLTKRRQRLGDLLAGTLVVHSSEREDRPHYLYLRQEDFLYFREALAPKPVTEDIRRHYLKFAFPALIARGWGPATPTPELLEQWEKYARSIFQNAPAAAELDQNGVLRFFAELCFQAEREAQGA